MATKKSASKKAVKKAVASKRPAKAANRSDLYYSLNELWHAVRQMGMMEETICTLREEAKHSQQADAEFRRDLKRLLKQFPLREITEASTALEALARG